MKEPPIIITIIILIEYWNVGMSRFSVQYEIDIETGILFFGHFKWMKYNPLLIFIFFPYFLFHMIEVDRLVCLVPDGRCYTQFTKIKLKYISRKYICYIFNENVQYIFGSIGSFPKIGQADRFLFHWRNSIGEFKVDIRVPVFLLAKLMRRKYEANRSL